ncbi:hypothetical protein GCM10022244_42890 [Streptomyces gulbargensis]|uniref:Integral membrane protein n=1 Tax=Streptomyces gulbargensis TaxID=364901 RepID=A0ABP7MV07_9ACTN
MYGPPQPPPSPKGPASGGLVALRVLFIALPLLSCGFLAWAPLLRLAVLTRRKLDWVLFGLTLAVAAGLFVFMGVTGEESTDLEAVLGVGLIVTLAAGSVAYYVVGEIRHFDRAASGIPPYGAGAGDWTGGAPAHAVTVPSPVTAPNPYTSTPSVTPAPPVTPLPSGGSVGPPPVVGGARIEQVRAELDELSDLLRKDPRDPGDGEGRR